jgi:hypothetical protein
MTSKTYFKFVTFLFLTGFAFILQSKADEAGKVCVEKISINSGWDANDTGASEGSIFAVQIDDLATIYVSTNSSGAFTNLSLNKEHLVKIKLDNKPLTSFRFRFEQRGNYLRLWYNPFYGTWSLSDIQNNKQ